MTESRAVRPIDTTMRAAWRLDVASRAARHYAGNSKLAALVVAGSVGAGLADRFSDLELDCYWFTAPGDSDRTGPIDAMNGELEALWDYDEDDEEWSEDYRLGDLHLTVALQDLLSRVGASPAEVAAPPGDRSSDNMNQCSCF